LLPIQGAIYWNGRIVTDPANFFVPPLVLIPQIPQLFSNSLKENMLLGLDKRERELAKAMEIAVFARDVAAMPAGWKLWWDRRACDSGAIAAGGSSRMFVRQPELLVLTTSSALDVETEQSCGSTSLRPIWIT